MLPASFKSFPERTGAPSIGRPEAVINQSEVAVVCVGLSELAGAFAVRGACKTIRPEHA
jgi:hypothetical protein